LKKVGPYGSGAVHTLFCLGRRFVATPAGWRGVPERGAIAVSRAEEDVQVMGELFGHVQHPPPVLRHRRLVPARDTSLIRNIPPVRPCSSPIPRDLW